MYISKLELTDMRCYEKVIIDLMKDDTPFSLMLAGNNGSGKSAILRSIAMGLCDQASAGSLLRELLGDFIRKDKKKKKRRAIITINLEDKDKNGKTIHYQIQTTITTNEKLGFEVVEQTLKGCDNNKELKQDEFPWHKIFVTAYGAGLRTEGTEDYGQYFAADAVYSLFKYSHPMQNPELIWRRLREVAREVAREVTREVAIDSKNIKKDKGKLVAVLGSDLVQRIEKLLRTGVERDLKKDAMEELAETRVDDDIKSCLLQILNLSENSSVNESEDNIEIENNGIFITSSWGKQELSALGDGYRALTTMIMDIISWQLLMKNNEVILQELESHEAGDWHPLGPIEDCTGIVIIDEIEKHLHPRLQRLIIKKLKDVFPKIQFIISSHSPLCVAGTADVEDEYMIYRTLTENGNNCVERWTGGLSGLRTDQILEHFFKVPYINEGTLLDMETYSRLYLMGEEGREGQDKKIFLEVTERLKKSAKSTFLELESKLLDKTIRTQSEKIEKMIEDDND
ncbi:MAG: AAA family ATPase [Candidatus Anammoxibacter sp.]